MRPECLFNRMRKKSRKERVSPKILHPRLMTYVTIPLMEWETVHCIQYLLQDDDAHSELALKTNSHSQIQQRLPSLTGNLHQVVQKQGKP